MPNSFLEKIRNVFKVRKNKNIDVAEEKYNEEIIEKMINFGDYNFVTHISDNDILHLCEKYNSNIFIKELLKKDFSRIENIINIINSSMWTFSNQKLYYSQLLEYMCEIDYNKTIELLKKLSYKKYGLIENSDYLNLSNILCKNGFSDEDYREFYSTRDEPFLLALLQKNPEATLIKYSDYDLSKIFNVKSDKIIDKILNILRDYRVEDLPKCALKNQRILNHYIKNEKEIILITKLLGSTKYSKENEQELLKMFDKKYDSVEQFIQNMYHEENTKKRNNMSIYEILVFQVYAHKVLKKLGVDNCKIDMFKRDKENQYGSYNYIKPANMFVLDVVNNDVNVTEMVIIIHHEINHIIQKKNISSNGLVFDRDTDLYTKDNFLKMINRDFKDMIKYYSDNYTNLGVEYYAEYNAYIEAAKLFGAEDICYDVFKTDINLLPKTIMDKIHTNRFPSYSFNINRKGKEGEMIHLNDLVEMHLDEVLKDEELKEKIKEETPLILYEYNIEKENMPRRRTTEELVELLNASKNNKDKNIYFMLLLNRFDERKEKEGEVLKNIEIIKTFLKEGKIKEELAKNLLSSIKRKEIEGNKESVKKR